MHSKFPVFISSADSYSDLWPIFFDLFLMYWPSFDGKIYLNTESKSYKHHYLDITCTQVGKFDSFGKTFRAGLDQIESEDLMLIMIDYIFMGPVDAEKLNKYFSFFKSNDLDSFCLAYQKYREHSYSGEKAINLVIPPSQDMFSYQIAFWKKSILYEMALPHENPWTSEWYGTRRANKMKLKLACPATNNENPIPYDLAGCLHKGKWLKSAIEHLNSINYTIDFDQRGIYTDPPRNIKNRIAVKKMLIKDGLKGSYWDLIKRKAGQWNVKY